MEIEKKYEEVDKKREKLLQVNNLYKKIKEFKDKIGFLVNLSNSLDHILVSVDYQDDQDYPEKKLMFLDMGNSIIVKIKEEIIKLNNTVNIVSCKCEECGMIFEDDCCPNCDTETNYVKIKGSVDENIDRLMEGKELELFEKVFKYCPLLDNICKENKNPIDSCKGCELVEINKELLKKVNITDKEGLCKKCGTRLQIDVSDIS
jgi:hypothetical protein